MTTDRRDAASPARAGGVARNQPRKDTTVDYPTQQCGSCPAQVIWATTERGKPMPVDAEPSSDGTVLLEPLGLGYRARVLPAHRAFGRKDLRKSHFATCPDAQQWRRTR